MNWNGIEIQHPVNLEDIEGAKTWIKWYGYSDRHQEFEYAAYITKNNTARLGLPPDTPIMAIADGRVCNPVFVDTNYGNLLTIEHRGSDIKSRSQYIYISTHLKKGDYVEKGQVIGELYTPELFLPRLSIQLRKGDIRESKAEDPAVYFSGLNIYNAVPQGCSEFIIQELPEVTILHSRPHLKLVNGVIKTRIE